MAHHGQRQFDDALGQPAHVHDLARQHEERHRQQREGVCAVDDVLRQDLGVKQIQVPHQRNAADEE